MDDERENYPEPEGLQKGEILRWLQISIEFFYLLKILTTQMKKRNLYATDYLWKNKKYAA